MRKTWRKLAAVVLSVVMAVFCAVPSFAALKLTNLIPNQSSSTTGKHREATTAVSTDQNPGTAAPSAGNTASSGSQQQVSKILTVMVSGLYDTFDRQDVLDLINAARKEAFDEGLVSKYVPLKWSGDMESIARQRAVESILSASHTRTNGDVWYTAASGDGVQPDAENLAWGKSVDEALDDWYAGKQTYAESKTFDDTTGNYYNLINPDYKYIGVSSFSVGEGTVRRCVCAELSKESSLSTEPQGDFGSTTVDVDVLRSNVTLRLAGPSSVSVGKRYRYAVNGSYTDANADSYNGTFTVSFHEDPVWVSSNTAAATISSSGILTGVAAGKTSVSATLFGKTVNKNVTVS